MEFSIAINDINRDIHYFSGSLSVALTANQIATGSCTLRSNIADLGNGVSVPDWRPNEGDQFGAYWRQSITDPNAIRFFVGVITDIETRIIAPKWVDGVRVKSPVWHQLTLAGLEWRLGKRIITSSTSYSGLTGSVVSRLLTDYPVDGIRADQTYVQAGASSVSNLVYGANGTKSVYAAIIELAQQDGYVFYVDAEGFPHYEPRGFTRGLSITPAENNIRDIRITSSLTDRANSVSMRVNYQAFAPKVESFAGDGSTTSFNLSEKVARIESVKIINGQDGYPRTFGSAQADTSDVEWTFTPGDTTIRMNSDAWPALMPADILQVTYRPVGSDIITAQDSSAVNSPGLVIERAYQDLSITSASDAALRAAAKLSAGMATAYQLDVETNTINTPDVLLLQPGHISTIENLDIGAADDYVVESVSISDKIAMLAYQIRYSGAAASQLIADFPWIYLATAGNTVIPPSGNSGSAQPLSPAAQLKTAIGGGTGTGNVVNQTDPNIALDPPVEHAIFGFGADAAIAADDISLWKHSAWSTGLPYEALVNCETAGAFTVVFDRSADGGTTWESLGGCNVAASTAVQVYNGFNGIYVNRGDKVRCRCTASDGVATYVHVTLRWRRFQATGGDASPTTTN